MLGLARVNAGVATAGQRRPFARWKPPLRTGDIVYLPLEEAQFTRTSSAASVGPDASIMFRHDRGTLAGLSSERWLGAAFSFGSRAALMSARIEMVLDWSGFDDPRESARGSLNAWGDHVGHTPARGQTRRR